MTDYQAEAVSKTRVPKDEFEAELFRQHIQSDTKRWYDTDKIKVSVGDSPDEYGAYDLYIWEPAELEFDVLRAHDTKGEMRGKVWLAENEYPVSEYYRVQVWHEIEGRAANYGAAPVIRWVVGGDR